jgi:bifunctional enzyme CysN/CysC
MAPQHGHRDIVRQILGEKLTWIHIHAPLEVCIQRDPKGLYRRAQAGKLDQLINYPFDAPRADEKEHHIDTVEHDVAGAAQKILTVVQTILPVDRQPSA